MDDEKARDEAAEETLQAIRQMKDAGKKEPFCLVTAAFADGIRAGQRLEQLEQQNRQGTA